MAVPNTNTFSFQDVTMEIYGDTATGRNLSQAFTDATGTLDQTYEGNHDRQLIFATIRIYQTKLPFIWIQWSFPLLTMNLIGVLKYGMEL